MMTPISTIRMRELHAVGREMSYTHADIKEVALERFGRHSLKDLAEEEAVEIIIEWRREMAPKAPQQEPSMTLTKGFPRLLVPRPPLNSKPAQKPFGYVKTPDPVMHAARPVDRVRPPPRYVAPLPAGVAPQRPENSTPAPAAHDTPSFVTGRKPAVPAGDRQTGGLGRVTTAPAPAATKSYPPAVKIRYDANGRPLLSADEIPY